CHGLALLRPGLKGYDGLPGVHADTNGQVQYAGIFVELGDSLEDTEPRSDGPLSVVLVCHRGPEEGHHRVPNEFLDSASETLNFRTDFGVVRIQGSPDVLWICLVRPGSESDQVTEE